MTTKITEYLLNQLAMHGYLFHKYGREENETGFTINMNLLHKELKNEKIEETCKYFEKWSDEIVRKHESTLQN